MVDRSDWSAEKGPKLYLHGYNYRANPCPKTTRITVLLETRERYASSRLQSWKPADAAYEPYLNEIFTPYETKDETDIRR